MVLIGILGKPNAGKSTLLKLLARKNKPASGQITLDTQILDTHSTRDFARKVAYLPQSPIVPAHLSVRELVGFGRYPWHGPLGRLKAEDRARIERALQLTDTQRFAERLVDSLSGGERQRVWLAMLLAQDSRYLLLDEPTSALDIAHQVEVLALVRKLCAELGLGVVVVLHDINLAARYCDRLVALHSGRLLVEGSPAQLMTSDTLASIYGIGMTVMPHPRAQAPIAVVH